MKKWKKEVNFCVVQNISLRQKTLKTLNDLSTYYRFWTATVNSIVLETMLKPKLTCINLFVITTIITCSLKRKKNHGAYFSFILVQKQPARPPPIFCHLLSDLKVSCIPLYLHVHMGSDYSQFTVFFCKKKYRTTQT